MKHSFTSIVISSMVLFLVGACTPRAQRTAEQLEMLMDSLKSQYVPDDRIEWWNVSVQVEEGTVQLSGEVASRNIYKALVRNVDQQFPEVENTLVLLPVDGDGQFVNGLINNSVANIRREPSSRTEMVTQALLGTPIRILKEENGWCLIQTPNGYIGWVNDFETQSADQQTLNAYRDAQKLIFSEQYGVSYAEPNENSMPVSDLVIGCILPILSEQSSFYQVVYPDGRLAWVKKDETIPADSVFYKSLSPDGLVETVLGFNGIPYLWGGASSKALDCSGLATNVYFMNGTILPRDADQQSLCGKVITTEYSAQDLVTGDLLFFGRKATDERPESVTHVAMYLKNSEFIHASGYRDRVSINSMDSTMENYIPDYPEIFIRAVRIVGEPEHGIQPIAQNDFYKAIIHSTE